MMLLRTKVWNWLDIGLLKWCSVLFGMFIGAYLYEFVREHVWYFVLVAVVLAISPTVAYFRD